MSSPELNANVGALKAALSGFLKTVLGKDVPVDVAPPQPAAKALADAKSVRIMHPSVLSPDWYIFLDDGWIPVLSAATIGEPMTADQEGADELLREVVTQAYVAVSRALTERGVAWPEVELGVQPRAEAAPTFPGSAVAARVSARTDDQELSAWIVMRDASAILSTPSEKKSNVSDVAVSPAGFPDLGPENINSGDGAIPNFDLMAEVQLEVAVELGRRSIPLAELLRLTTGSVIELEKLVGEPLEVYANGRLIAEGEAVVIDEQFGIRITRLASVKQRARAFS
ncbi:MAG TPA: flagellar motor switch protein FliN [Rhodothermales bacterium]